jgi:hypothetical protein
MLLCIINSKNAALRNFEKHFSDLKVSFGKATDARRSPSRGIRCWNYEQVIEPYAAIGGEPV